MSAGEQTFDYEAATLMLRCLLDHVLLRSVCDAETATRIVKAARSQIGETTGYDSADVSIPYTNGEIPRQRGV